MISFWFHSFFSISPPNLVDSTALVGLPCWSFTILSSVLVEDIFFFFLETPGASRRLNEARGATAGLSFHPLVGVFGCARKKERKKRRNEPTCPQVIKAIDNKQPQREEPKELERRRWELGDEGGEIEEEEEARGQDDHWLCLAERIFYRNKRRAKIDRKTLTETKETTINPNNRSGMNDCLLH